MQDTSIAAAIGALGFWGFVAAVVVAAIWYYVRKQEAQHETLRRIVESGQQIDDAVVDKLLSISGGGSKDMARDLKIGSYVVLSLAPGLVVFGWILSLALAPVLFPVMLGVSALLAFIGGGLWAASYVAARPPRRDHNSQPSV